MVRDAAFRRVKVKAPAYVALAHLHSKGGGSAFAPTAHASPGPLKLNVTLMLQIVRANESDEFLCHFPQYASRAIRRSSLCAGTALCTSSSRHVTRRS